MTPQVTPQVSDLAAFLRAGGARPFAWGVQDCCLWAADWVRLATGRDPAAGWRDHYRSALGAARIVARRGGFEAHVAACLAGAGLSETSDPRPGDVGIVELANGPTLAVRTSVCWAAKGKRDVLLADAPCLRAWSVPCR